MKKLALAAVLSVLVFERTDTKSRNIEVQLTPVPCPRFEPVANHYDDSLIRVFFPCSSVLIPCSLE